MERALCTLDGQIYPVTAFEQLTAFDMNYRRQHLVCQWCHGPAFYRQGTPGGRASCFGARPHAPLCVGASVQAASSQDGGCSLEQAREMDRDAALAQAERIVLHLAYGGVEPVLPPDMVSSQGDGTPMARVSGQGAGSLRCVHRRLGSVLRLLTSTPAFQRSRQLIQLQGSHACLVKDFLVPFAKVDRSHEGRYHGYWGMVTYARRDAYGALWLNTGGKLRTENLRICVQPSLVSVLYARFGVQGEEDMAGAYVLVVGPLKVKAGDLMRYVVVDDLAALTLQPVTEVDMD